MEEAGANIYKSDKECCTEVQDIPLISSVVLSLMLL